MRITYKQAVGLVKQAGIYGDIARSTAGNVGAGMVVPYGSGLANLGGTIHGIATEDPETAKVNSGMNWIPAYGTSQVVQQRRNLSRQMGNYDDKLTAASEQFGGLTANILPALLLAGLGGYAGWKFGEKPARTAATEMAKDPHSGVTQADIDNMTNAGRVGTAGLGAGVGAMVGGLAGPTMGTLLALLRRRRTPEEQKAYEQGGKAMNWLMPGAAEYNKYKAQGFIHGQQVEADRKNKEGGDKGEDKDKKKKPEETKNAK